jgi:hypothetical protein
MFRTKVVAIFYMKPVSSVSLPGFEIFKLDRVSCAVSSINSKTVE